MSRFVVVLFLLSYLTSTVLSVSVPLTLLSDVKAKCLDGTQSGYYFLPASDPNQAHNYIIHLQGGGECGNKGSCTGATKSALGSSKYFAKELSGFGFYNNLDCKANPDFCGWNHIQLPYCSQDLHSGIADPSEATWGLYFHGRYIFDAVIDELASKHGLNDAEIVIISGDSAGGLGTWYHLDNLQERLPKAQIIGGPIAGYYFPAHPYTGPNHTQSYLANFTESGLKELYHLWNAQVDSSCATALSSSPWLCLVANESIPYIKSRAYIVEAQTDKVVILDHDSLPEEYMNEPEEQAYLREWSHNMTTALRHVSQTRQHGIFNAACFIHTDFYSNAPLIQGYNYYRGFHNWLNGQEPYNFQDDCGIICNPTCPK
eukprot:TRINITY_DN6078_c0_g1_i1.p1 TRINITY_DN6078_c0_g1~~TRINITY_DN6078_c0_g1_i1.p1  ORF type:complete len:373 (+),score=59.43 TRINITY_DN6078_c0_g1_i1:58-1176(+)